MRRAMGYRPFYPGDCRSQLDAFLETASASPDPASLPPAPVAAIAPHAGWIYSGAVAARSLAALGRGSPPSVLVLLGAVHRTRLDRAALWPRGSWETPLGDLPVDADVAREVLEVAGDLVEERPEAHEDEHSLEVLAPMVRHLLPDARIVPIMVPPTLDAVALGRALAPVGGGQRVAVVASTDLTHYGPAYGFAPAGTGPGAHDWMRRNDRRLVEKVIALDAEAVVEEAMARRNACGPAGVAAAVAFARERGVQRGVLLERTDSHEARGSTDPFEMAVGYAGIIF